MVLEAALSSFTTERLVLNFILDLHFAAHTSCLQVPWEEIWI